MSTAVAFVVVLLITGVECSSFTTSSSGRETTFTSYLMGYPHCQQQFKHLEIHNASIFIVKDSPCHYDMVGSSTEDNQILGLIVPTGRPACAWETITTVAKAHNYIGVLFLNNIWSERSLGAFTRISWHTCDVAGPFFVASIIQSDLTGHWQELKQVSLRRSDNPYDTPWRMAPLAILCAITFILAFLKGYIVVKLGNVQRKHMNQVASVLVILCEGLQSLITMALLGDYSNFSGIFRIDVFIILLNASSLLTNLSTAFIAYAFLLALESVGILSPRKSRKIIIMTAGAILIAVQTWAALSLCQYISDSGLNSAAINATVCVVFNILASTLFVMYKSRIKKQMTGKHKTHKNDVGKMGATLRMSVLWIIISNVFLALIGVAGLAKDYVGVQWTSGMAGLGNILTGCTQLLSLGSVEEAGFGKLQDMLVNLIQSTKIDPDRKSSRKSEVQGVDGPDRKPTGKSEVQAI